MAKTRKPVILAVVALAILGAAAVLYAFPPEAGWFYPRCMFHVMTGLDCPGCGGLRATHQLLHGNLRQALALNPLIFILLPFLGWMLLSWLVQEATGHKLRHPFRHPAWLWTLLGVVVVFSIVRNFPFGPLALLSP